MITVDSATSEALSAPNVNIVKLVKMDFPSTVLALNTSNFDLTYDGVVYKGAYGLGSISEIEDSPGEIKGLNFTLNASAADTISLALDEAADWQVTRITVRTAILNDSFQIVNASIAWRGLGDTLSIEETSDSSIVSATAESEVVDFMRGHKLSFNDSDQKMLYPTDRGFELLESQLEASVVWPAAAWFRK